VLLFEVTWICSLDLFLLSIISDPFTTHLREDKKHNPLLQSQQLMNRVILTLCRFHQQSEYYPTSLDSRTVLYSPKLAKKPNPNRRAPVKESSRKLQFTIINPSDVVETHEEWRLQRTGEKKGTLLKPRMNMKKQGIDPKYRGNDSSLLTLACWIL